MPFNERKELILGFSCVDEVVSSIDDDSAVCKTILSLKKDNKINVLQMVEIEETLKIFQNFQYAKIIRSK